VSSDPENAKWYFIGADDPFHSYTGGTFKDRYEGKGILKLKDGSYFDG
jgi:hypothetical protein